MSHTWSVAELQFLRSATGFSLELKSGWTSWALNKIWMRVSPHRLLGRPAVLGPGCGNPVATGSPFTPFGWRCSWRSAWTTISSWLGRMIWILRVQVPTLSTVNTNWLTMISPYWPSMYHQNRWTSIIHYLIASEKAAQLHSHFSHNWAA